MVFDHNEKNPKQLNRIGSGFEPILHPCPGGFQVGLRKKTSFQAGLKSKVVSFPRLHWCWQLRSMPITAWATPQIPCVPMRILVPCWSADPTSLRASLPAAPARWVRWKTGSWFWAFNKKREKHKTPTLGKEKDVNQLKMAFFLNHQFVHNKVFEVETCQAEIEPNLGAFCWVAFVS